MFAKLNTAYMRNFKAYFLTLILFSAGILNGYSQVTTSGMSGVVRSGKGEPLVGATVVLRHEPTGSAFTTITRTGGIFDLNNLPPGGPYTVTITYTGYVAYKKSDINIPLGEKFDLQTELTDKELQSVIVTAAGRRGVTEKTGASTNISNRLVQNMPNIARSLSNLTRVTPQSNGNSFAGMNNRYNNLMIDGSLFNNNFGRSGDGMIPGGATSAISIDAVDQVQVNIAPYDVRQAGFVGSGINAVTRRGTNNFYGTVYGYYRNQDFNGKKVKEIDINNAKRSTKIYGASVGGPIIKDKLFFFLNYESEKRTQPGQTYVAKKSATDNDPNATAVLASDLDAVKNYLINNNKLNNYNPGAYEGYDFETDNKKFLGRLDWNITSKHRLTLRYTHSETNDDDMVNSSSVTGVSANRINNSRRGGATGGMAFSGSNFKNNVKVWSAVAELNSTFSNRWSNQLIASYTNNELVRIPNSSMPFVDIMRDPNNVYISLGTDLFSYMNEIKDKALNIADNVTYTLGKHTFTGGVSFDKMQFANSFTSAGGPSYYRFNSLNDFLTDKAPAVFAVAYDPSNKLGIKVPEAKFSQLGFYAQDIFSVTNKLKVTYGLRVDLPFYPYTPPRNEALEQVVFKDQNLEDEQFDVSKWPKQKPLFSPRLGFTYDAKGDKSLVVRGGTGVFTGRIPFIWLVNQVGDDGVVRALYQPTGTALAAIRYSADRTTYLKDFTPPEVGKTIPAGSPSYSAAAKDFKMPQVWRSNLAVDKRFGNNYTATFEAIYTKMINNVYFRNANQGPETSKLAGADNRPYYQTRLNSNISQMIVMDNTSKGYSLALTAQLQKAFSDKWEAGVAYTYTLAKEVAIGSSDQSGSGFNTNNIIFNPNKPDLGHSNYAVPHRIVANVSYRLEYLDKRMATTFSLFYAAQPQERYSFRYGGDINGDGQSNDVLYIPKDASEISFVDNAVLAGKTYTAQQQSDAFFNFVNNDKYLKDHKGEYMTKYGAKLPWNHTVDLRVLQDFIYKRGTQKHTLQFSVDVINLLNLLNSQWGYRYSYTYGTFQDMGILGTPTGFNPASPKFTFDPANPAKAYQPNYSTTSTWGIQLGLRYTFN
jgi:hypothetical protein